MLRGVNLAGAEFGAEVLPGVENRHYVFPSEATVHYFASQGLTLFRIPFAWERLQPVALGPLDSAYLDGLHRTVEFARRNSGFVILEPHNFGRYFGAVLQPGILADLWRRVSLEFNREPAVQGYGLMNEPHDLGRLDWHAATQSAVDAVRATGDGKRIYVPGDRWSNAHIWTRVNGPRAWIHDPANNHQYEAHLYFDADASGRYLHGYDKDRGVSRLQGFLAWCRDNGVQGFLGEHGIPDDDSRWLPVLDRLLAELDAAAIDGTYWAAGEWWGNYRLSVQPREHYTQHRPQMEVLRRHASTVDSNQALS